MHTHIKFKVVQKHDNKITKTTNDYIKHDNKITNDYIKPMSTKTAKVIIFTSRIKR